MSYAGSHIFVLDLAPDGSTPVRDEAGGPDGRRWKPGDPVPVRILMDYHTGREACERDPARYRAVGMSDDDYAVLVKAFEARQAEAHPPK